IGKQLLNRVLSHAGRQCLLPCAYALKRRRAAEWRDQVIVEVAREDGINNDFWTLFASKNSGSKKVSIRSHTSGDAEVVHSDWFLVQLSQSIAYIIGAVVALQH